MRIKYYSMATVPNHGYGRIGGKIRTALQAAGATMLDRMEGGWDLRLIVGTPDSWYLDHDMPDLVLHTMWEARPLPDNWLPWVNRAGALWAPSQFVADIMREGGVSRPILVAGYGVDPEEYAYVERERDAGAPYTFLVWAQTMMDRKETLLAIKAFAKAKLPGARMIVKHNWNLGIDSHDGELAEAFRNVDVQQFHGRYCDAPIEGVTVMTGTMSPGDMARLMYHCDAMVYPSAAEGFGLMPLEAMATGLTVIAPAYSGLAEYISDQTAVPLPIAGFKDSALMREVWGRPASVPRVELDDVVERMRWCYEHQDAARDLGRRAAAVVAREWTWPAAGRRALALLQAYADGRQA